MAKCSSTGWSWRVSTLAAASLLLATACSDSGDGGGANQFGALIDEAPAGDAFYLPPDPPPGEPGDIIWVKDGIPVEGGTLYVLLYRSESVRGVPIGVSGWIAVPDGDAPPGGRPVVSWAHGSRGVGDQCAPTRQDDPPSKDMPLLASLLQRGIVVVASDYEGLGTPGLHPYSVGEPEGRSVLDAARAAQRFRPAQASRTVVLVGHSQGGHAIAYANQMAEGYAPELDVIGAVGSGAGVVSQGSGIVEYLINSRFKAYMVLAMAALEAAYGPELAPASRLLTPRGVAEIPHLEDGCVRELIDYFAPIPTHELFKSEYDLHFTDGSDPTPLSQAGLAPGTAPMLLVHGTADSQIPAAFIPEYAQNVCNWGQALKLNWYVGYEHRALYDPASGAADAVLVWIDARLRGEPAPSDCGALPPLPS